MQESRERIRYLLFIHRLTQVWLINHLSEQGVEVDKSEMSAVLNGSRKGPKATQVINQSLALLESLQVSANK